MNQKKNILVTGGAGYIGSVVCQQLKRDGHRITILDDLSNSYVPKPETCNEFWQEDIRTFPQSLGGFDLVCHLAAEADVAAPAHSVFSTNVSGMVHLLNQMKNGGVRHIINSSSASVYGRGSNEQLKEFRTDMNDCSKPLGPCSPYGHSKLMAEEMLSWAEQEWGLKNLSFRYFNVAGAARGLGENRRVEKHLIPRAFEATMSEPIEIYGGQHQHTYDGTCIRDYIHVEDVANAHTLAVNDMDKWFDCGPYNVCSGVGTSVREVLQKLGDLKGEPVPCRVVGPRKEDPEILWGDYNKIREVFGWSPLFHQTSIFATALQYWRNKGR